MNLLRPLLTIALLFAIAPLALAAVSDFENFPLASNSFNNGNPGGLLPGQTHNGSFSSGGAVFNNVFGIDAMFDFPYWNGWSYSNQTDVTTPGFGNQYSAFTGGGAGGSAKYGIASVTSFDGPTITLPAGIVPVSMQITNTTYAALSMLQGDSFAKKFGDDPQTLAVVETNFPDWFKLTITGRDAAIQPIGAPLEFYLADYRFANDAQDYLVNTWQTVDLTGLAGARTLSFNVTGNDNSQFGLNTPAYFAADNFVTTIPEPGMVALLVVCAGVRFFMRRKKGQGSSKNSPA